MNRSVSKKKPAKKAVGISERKFDQILGDIVAGEPAYKAAQARGVTMGTFWRELSKTPKRVEKYTRAKTMGLERLAEEILEISDESRIGEKTKTIEVTGSDAEGEPVKLPAVEVTTGDMIERAKLQVDSRKWLLAKMMPHKYGDRTAIDHTFNGDAMADALRRARERSIQGQ